MPSGYVRTWWGPLVTHPHDGLSAHLEKYGVYDKKLSYEILRRTKRGMTVFNIGANIGYMALLASKKAKAVYAFEPDPRTFEILERNTMQRNHCDMHCEKSAMGDRNATVKYFLEKEAFGNSSLCKENMGDHVSTSVEMKTMDDFCMTKNVRPDLIVMDVQGAELSVFRGGIQILSEYRPTILFELWPFGLENMGDSAEKLREFLDGIGYVMEKIDTGFPDPEKDWSKLLNHLRSVKNGRGFCNVCAVKR